MLRSFHHHQLQAQSFASRSPLAQTQTEIDANLVREWDRRLLFTLGVAGVHGHPQIKAPLVLRDGIVCLTSLY